MLRVYGTSCIRPCWCACVSTTRLIGAEPASMAHRCQAPGGQETGPNPTDRAKLGTKRHIVVDARGVPLVVLLSGANRHDSMMFEKCIDALPAVRGYAACRVVGHRSCMQTRATTTRDTERICVGMASQAGLPGAASKAASVWANIGGWWRRPTRGLPGSASCAFALSAGWTFTGRCSCWPPQSSAHALSNGRISHSKASRRRRGSRSCLMGRGAVGVASSASRGLSNNRSSPALAAGMKSGASRRPHHPRPPHQVAAVRFSTSLQRRPNTAVG